MFTFINWKKDLNYIDLIKKLLIFKNKIHNNDRTTADLISQLNPPPKINNTIENEIIKQKETFIRKRKLKGKLSSQKLITYVVKKEEKNEKNHEDCSSKNKKMKNDNISSSITELLSSFFTSTFPITYSQKISLRKTPPILPFKYQEKNRLKIEELFKSKNILNAKFISERQKSNYLSLKNLISTYSISYNEYFYYNYFLESLIKIENLFNKKYQSYFQISQTYKNQIKQSEFYLLQKEEKKELIEEIIESLEEEENHELAKVEDQINTDIKEEVSKFKNYGFLRGKSGLDLIEQQYMTEIFTLSNLIYSGEN